MVGPAAHLAGRDGRGVRPDLAAVRREERVRVGAHDARLERHRPAALEELAPLPAGELDQDRVRDRLSGEARAGRAGPAWPLVEEDG